MACRKLELELFWPHCVSILILISLVSIKGSLLQGKGTAAMHWWGGRLMWWSSLFISAPAFMPGLLGLRGASLLPLGTNCCFSVLPLSEAAASVTKMWNILGWSVSWMWMRFWCALLKSKTNPILHSAWEFPLHWNETVKCSPACASPFSCCFGSWNV